MKTAGRHIPARALLVSLAFALFVCGPSYRRPRATPPSQPSVQEPTTPDLDDIPLLVGQPSSDLIEPDDTLLDVAHRHRLGFDRVSRLNPDVKVWIPDAGTVVQLPTEHVLPDAPHRGLVINVPEMQLYDYTGGDPPEVFAIAIGDQMDPSLTGEFKVGSKRENPAWHVPASIRAEKPDLPAVVPAGPDNPLGPYWMTIGTTSYGIHGTNNPWSIGREATHGCIRLYNDEIARLYARVRPGTPIRLLYQPVKIGRRDGLVYLEAHPDIYGRDPDLLADAFERIHRLGLTDAVDPGAVRRAVEQARGIPVPVGSLLGPEFMPDYGTPPPPARSSS